MQKPKKAGKGQPLPGLLFLGQVRTDRISNIQEHDFEFQQHKAAGGLNPGMKAHK